MTTQNGRAFNEWLRAQLKAKKMSQRQLAQQSGVDHSTISRLIRGDRMPSLGTATKLARGLRELRDDADTPQYLGPRVVRLDEPDRPRRVRAARRRASSASRRSARSWSTTSPSGCAGSAAPTSPTADPTRPMPSPYLRGGGAPPSPVGAGSAPARSTGRPARDRSAHPADLRRADREPLLTIIRLHDPDPSLHVRVSGIANAGLWGAGVRACPGPDRALGRRHVDRDRPAGRGHPAIDEPERRVARRPCDAR